MKATAYFTQIYKYEIILPEDLQKEKMHKVAFSLAEEQFISEMCRPIAHCDYDKVEIEFEEQ